MIRLDTTTRKLIAALSGPVTTTQLAVSVSYSDKTTASYAGGMQLSATNDAMPVDICNAPGASTTRDVDYISVKNLDTAPASITISYDDNGTPTPIFAALLASGDHLCYVHGSGWQVLNGSGQLLTSGSQGATGPQGPAGMVGMDGLDGEDGMFGPPGLPGAQGATGNTGATGATGPQGPMSVSILPGEDGEDGITIPGTQSTGGAFTLAHVGPGIKQGLTLSNNVTDATNDLDIATGKAVDSTGAVAMSLASAMTKRLDANWAAGTNQGGRYSGAAIANTTYHVWLVAKAAGADVDVYLNPSADAATVLTNLQAETGGADYLYVWRIGSIMRESGVIVPFVQNFSEFQRKTPLMDIAASSTGTSAVLRAFAIPTGLKLLLKYYAYYRNSTGAADNYSCYFSDPDVTDQAPSITTSPGLMGGDGPLLDSRQGMVFLTRTNISAQIRTRAGASSASATLYMSAHAWIDEGIYRG